MTDKNTPAGLTPNEARAVREWAERAHAAEVQDETVAHAARVLLAVLPKHPTLADMTAKERANCHRMQADVKGYENRAVIIQPYWRNGSARVMWAASRVEAVSWAHITPRPDLPRLEWPGDTPAPAPTDQEDYPPRDQLTQGAKWHDITKLEEALRQKGEAADQAIVIDDEGDVHVWEIIGGGGWMARVPVQQCGPFRLILNEQETTND